MHILFIHNSGETLEPLRGELISLAQSLGHRVTVCIPHDHKRLDRLKNRGIHFEFIPLQRTGTSFLHDLCYFLKLRVLICRYRPDWIFTTTVKPSIYGLLASGTLFFRRPKTCVLLTGLGYLFLNSENRKRNFKQTIGIQLYKFALRFCDLFLFQNPSDQKLFLDKNFLKVRTRHFVVGSGVDLNHFSESPWPPLPPLKFIMIARLLKDKGLYEYIEAARRLKLSHPAVECHLVGSRDDNPESISSDDLEALNNEKIVIYHPYQQDIRPLIQTSHVLVLPSYGEGAPRVVMEAMASGRPVITTDTAGCRDMIKNPKSGLLVKPRDKDSLTLAMMKLADESQNLSDRGKAARKDAEKFFDCKTINEKIINLMS